jgi:membrane-bound lytic murein transglycosylase D
MKKENLKKIASLFSVLLALFYIYYIPKTDVRSKENTTVSLASIVSINAEPEAEIIPPQRVHAVRISGEVTFAGELVPLNDYDVRERFDRELLVNTFWQSNTIINFKLANKYFETIDKILKEEGVPLDFRYLAVAESGLRDISSPAGASGIWQIMPATGTEYGLTVNSEVDERYHLEKSTRVACKYLKGAYEKLGSWSLAAASYNAGMGKIQQRLKEQQVDNFYDLYLNTETARYLYRILAYKMVFENPEKFGLYLEKEDLYEPIEYETVKIGGTIDDLAAFAKANNTTYKMLKITNPWLRDKMLTVKGDQVYEIKIPKNYIETE